MKSKKLLTTFIALIITLSLANGSNAQRRKVQTTKRAVVNQKGSLSIEVGLVFTSGDVKPVARAEFYLLNADTENILKKNYGNSTDLGIIATDINYPIFETRGVQKTLTAIKPHIVSFAITDFQGKAKFSSLKTGNYYLFGFAKAGKSAVVWNLQTVIKSGTYSIILDNNNAALLSKR